MSNQALVFCRTRLWVLIERGSGHLLNQARKAPGLWLNQAPGSAASDSHVLFWALGPGLGWGFLGLGRPGPDPAFLAQGPGDSQVLFLSILTGGQAETPNPETPNLHGCSFCENLLFRDSGIVEFDGLGGPGAPREAPRLVE